MPLNNDAVAVRASRSGVRRARRGPRALAILALLSLAGCVHSVEARRLQNPTTGAVISACGPLTGFDDLAERVQRECMKNYEAQGLVEVTR
jgi:hypothetical protein